MRAALVALSLPLAFAQTAAAAAPSPGERFPVSSARDLTGELQPDVLRPGAKNLVVVMTDRKAGEAARAWFAAADQRMPPSVHRVSLISLQLPFFVSEAVARGKARDQVPAPFWKASYLDRNGAMAQRLAVPHSHAPFVFAVDERGRILATAHGPASGPDAPAIWEALR